MVHERVTRDHCPKPRGNRPQTEIIIVIAPDAEPLIKHPNCVNHFPLD